MERYFKLYPQDEARAILHYQCNLCLAESFYVSLSVFEVTLRNALAPASPSAGHRIPAGSHSGPPALFHAVRCPPAGRPTPAPPRHASARRRKPPPVPGPAPRPGCRRCGGK